jgi:hypothetical protein
MERHSLSLHLAIALKNHEIRRACTAAEHILRAIEILDDLPPEALEVVRDYCDDYNNGRTGALAASFLTLCCCKPAADEAC